MMHGPWTRDTTQADGQMTMEVHGMNWDHIAADMSMPHTNTHRNPRNAQPPPPPQSRPPLAIASVAIDSTRPPPPPPRSALAVASVTIHGSPPPPPPPRAEGSLLGGVSIIYPHPAGDRRGRHDRLREDDIGAASQRASSSSLPLELPLDVAFRMVRRRAPPVRSHRSPAPRTNDVLVRSLLETCAVCVVVSISCEEES